MTQWSIEGRELVNCNCNFGCPCQFSVLPTDGYCEAAIVYDIKKGHYGDTSLDGVRAAAVYKWPGAIHEGNGQMQIIVDENASEDQRAAMEAIIKGEDTEEMATMWFVYSKMAPTKHETLTAPINVDMDMDERTGSAKVDGVFELNAKPIPHIVLGTPHRARINLPMGFEYDVAEAASGSTTISGGAIALERTSDSHAHFAKLNLTGSGVIGH
ncbi:DUF1326 domain-containing protein [Aliiroseovarius sp. PrR006]|uniref:DUF1326 domain-containing protein n=1 Tax=Aliiroseovarius sp. PrR006 TaxID=2706883 RepID=UPI0013CFDF3C|nr:DUF1326 domain-containing protein [Aliiroseovarius sp. PrR006]